MSRDAFLSAQIEERVVKIPGVGSFRARGLTAPEWSEYEAHCTKIVDGKPVYKGDRAKLVQLGTIGEGGLQIFTVDDLPVLQNRPAKLIRPLSDAIAEMSGVSDDLGND
jgi:hypothetical protein